MCVHEKMRIKKEKKSIRVFPNKPANPYIYPGNIFLTELSLNSNTCTVTSIFL